MTIVLGLGNQTFRAAAPLGEPVFGDTDGILDKGKGGRDRIEATFKGDYAALGDAGTLAGKAQGGADHLTIGSVGELAPDGDIPSKAIGDAESLIDYAQGGDDRIVAGDGVRAYGDGLLMEDHARGGDDTLTAIGRARLVGDAAVMDDDSQGGDDTIVTGRVFGFNDTEFDGAYGDAEIMRGRARGGDDHLTAQTKEEGVIIVIGDAVEMSEDSVGGDDTIVVKSLTSGALGDAFVLRDGAAGGDDHIISFAQGGDLIGDAAQMFDGSRGGNDRIDGSDSRLGRDAIIGDATTVFEEQSTRPGAEIICGNDLLRGLGGDDLLVGDLTQTFVSFVVCGDDVLAGGEGDDLLVGDVDQIIRTTVTLGSDRFVFGKNSGSDTIQDFGQGQDVMDLRKAKITSFDDLAVTSDGTDSVVQLGGGNQITVLGVAALVASDFLFA